MNIENLSQKSTRGLIINILSNKQPLTAKEIHHSLLKEHTKQISYQATHKTLKEMTEERVLEKEEKGFRINKNWIKNLSDYAKKLEKHSNENNEGVKTYNFNSIVEAGKFLINDFMGSWNTPNPEKKKAYACGTTPGH